ncbi:MAG: hypothetical protein AB8I08_16130 [Sandaracinaceae bacterium]
MRWPWVVACGLALGSCGQPAASRSETPSGGPSRVAFEGDALVLVSPRNGQVLGRFPLRGRGLALDVGIAPDDSSVALYDREATHFLGPNGVVTSVSRSGPGLIRSPYEGFDSVPETDLPDEVQYVFAQSAGHTLVTFVECRGLTIVDLDTGARISLEGTADEEANQDDFGDTHHAAFSADGQQVVVLDGLTASRPHRLRLFDTRDGRLLESRPLAEARDVRFVGEHVAYALEGEDQWRIRRLSDGHTLEGYPTPRLGQTTLVEGDVVTTFSNQGVETFDLSSEIRRLRVAGGGPPALNRERSAVWVTHGNDEVRLYSWPDARLLHRAVRPGLARRWWIESEHGFEALGCVGGELRRFRLSDGTESRLAECPAGSRPRVGGALVAIPRSAETQLIRLRDEASLTVRVRRFDSGERIVVAVANDGAFWVPPGKLRRLLGRAPGAAHTLDEAHPSYTPGLLGAFATTGSADRVRVVPTSP